MTFDGDRFAFFLLPGSSCSDGPFAIMVVNSLLQAAIMAPTEILARQHFEGIQEMLLKYNISSNLLV